MGRFIEMAMGASVPPLRVRSFLPLLGVFLVLCASADGAQGLAELSSNDDAVPARLVQVLPAEDLGDMVGIRSGGPGYKSLDVAPTGTLVLRKMKGDEAACKSACDKLPACQGFKHTSGNNECQLLHHKTGTIAKLNKKLRKDMVNAAKAKVRKQVKRVKPAVRATEKAARHNQRKAKRIRDETEKLLPATNEARIVSKESTNVIKSLNHKRNVKKDAERQKRAKDMKKEEMKLTKERATLQKLPLEPAPVKLKGALRPV